jgi:hypothetical protein
MTCYLKNTSIQRNPGKRFNTKPLVILILYVILFSFFRLFYVKWDDTLRNIQTMCGCESSSCSQANSLLGEAQGDKNRYVTFPCLNVKPLSASSLNYMRDWISGRSKLTPKNTNCTRQTLCRYFCVNVQWNEVYHYPQIGINELFSMSLLLVSNQGLFYF